MSDQLNKWFTDGPEVFLGNFKFCTVTHTSLAAASSGIKQVNLKWDALSRANGVCVTAQPSGHLKAHDFQAFWLKNTAKMSEELTLVGAADYMFTPMITGCRFVIDPAGPKVYHVDGMLSDAQMDKVCSTRATGANLTVKRYWDNGAFWATFVVGVRRQGNWRFFAQSLAYGAGPPFPTQQI